MARSDKNGMIDGFMAVQSVRRKSGRQDEPLPSSPSDGVVSAGAPSDAGEKEPRARTAPFGHTALPTRHEISCYACGYQFIVTGRLDRVICPKCKTQLTTGDKTICGPFSGTIETVGTVTIHAGARITDSKITASVIRIAGTCTRSALHPGVRVELETGAAIDTARMQDVDVLVVRKAAVHLQDTLLCRSLRVEGSIKADVRTQGQVVLTAHASYRGNLEATSLGVEDGACLQGMLAVIPRPAMARSDSSLPDKPGIPERSTPNDNATNKAGV